MVDPEHDDAAYLWDMLRPARTVREFVAGKNFNDYEKSRMLRSAVERQVEIVGEAANRVSANTKAAYPELPWRKMIAQRNVLAHDYGKILDEKMWQVASLHLVDLIEKLEPIVPPPPAGYDNPAMND